MFRYFSLPIVWALVTSSASLVRGQSELSVPEDTKFVAQIDVAAFSQTTLGEKLLQVTKAMAADELGGDGDELLAKLEESLGFNPLTEIRTLTVMGSDYDEPEENLSVIIQLGKTTGNIEGLMLALPGYASEDRGGHLIHSAKVDGMHGYIAIHTNEDASKCLVATNKKAELVKMLSSMEGKDRSAEDNRKVRSSVPEGAFAQLHVIAFPSELIEDGPPANIIKMLKDVSFVLSESGSTISADLRLTTLDEKRAEQIQQLAQGLKAMVSLFKEEFRDKKEMTTILSLAEDVLVERSGAVVTVHAAIPQQLIIEFLREEADLPL